MPNIELGIFDHVVFLALIAFSPWNARRRFHSLVKSVDGGDPNARTRSYRTVVVEKWIRLAVIAVAWIALSRSASSIGLTGSVSGLAIVGFGLTAAAIGAQLALTLSVVGSEQWRIKARESVASVRAFAPHTANEKRWFYAMSVSAGIEEELVFRGFLFAYFAALPSGAPVAVIIVLAGGVFGLGHLYQGVAGIVKTGTLGLLFGVLYWMTGSLWAPMLLHVVVDLSSGWMSWQILREDDPTNRAEPVAV